MTDMKLEQTISDWLEAERPGQLPDRVLRATFERMRKTRQQVGWRVLLGRLSMPRFVPALAGAAIVLVVAVVALSFYFNRPNVAVNPTVTPSASPTAPTSGGLWPQTTLEEVRQAQERADAGNPDYTWQVDPQLAGPSGSEGGEWDKWAAYLREPAPQIAERFLREELGWDAFLFNVYPTQGFQDDGGADGVIRGLVYSRCAPGKTNPLYPNDQEGAARGGENCAPTIDDLRYETVSVDLAQPDRRGPGGIWVVSGWRIMAPFAQVDTRVVQAAAAARLQEFLQARVDGEGAESYVNVSGSTEGLLLYATTTGARYERFEFELLGAQWPVGDLTYEIRLFADDGVTVVEQQAKARVDFLGLNRRLTTENGLPVPQPFVFLDGQVSLAAPYPWGYDGDGDHFWRLSPDDQQWVHIWPVSNVLPAGEGCASGAPAADAEALARAIELNPDLVATAPVTVTVGGRAALTMDITAAPSPSLCEDQGAYLLTYELAGKRRELPIDTGTRMRLYLVDMPVGSSLEIVAIAIVAPEADFQSLVDEAAPILESVEFNTP